MCSREKFETSCTGHDVAIAKACAFGNGARGDAANHDSVPDHGAIVSALRVTNGELLEAEVLGLDEREARDREPADGLGVQAPTCIEVDGAWDHQRRGHPERGGVAVAPIAIRARLIVRGA